MQPLGINSVDWSQPIPLKFPSHFIDMYPPLSGKQDTENIYVAIDFCCSVKTTSHLVHTYCLGLFFFFFNACCFPNMAWVRDSQLAKDQQRRWFFFFSEEWLGHLHRVLTLWGDHTKLSMGFLGVDHCGSYLGRVQANLGHFWEFTWSQRKRHWHGSCRNFIHGQTFLQPRPISFYDACWEFLEQKVIFPICRGCVFIHFPPACFAVIALFYLPLVIWYAHTH